MKSCQFKELIVVSFGKCEEKKKVLMFTPDLLQNFIILGDLPEDRSDIIVCRA